MLKYFLYARKSTDVEDKQVLSIEAQLAELRMLTKRENLSVVDELIEKRSAKIPGRKIFNDMIERIQNGEAQGIVCWKIDRLSRNPVDSGKIQWMLQQGVIKHIQTHGQSHYPNDNVLMMSVELGMANEYVRQLSENTSRGLRQKARRGEFPGLAPLGYINNPIEKKIEVHHKNSKLVKKLFEVYATGRVRLEDLSAILDQAGLRSKKSDRRFDVSRVSHLITNPFYYGHFRYMGEIHEGKHTPIISKELFDRANTVLRSRGRIPDKETEVRPLCGLLSCGSCDMHITGEVRIKRQKNGNTHRYVYYHCTKKSKKYDCPEPAIREEELDCQLSAILLEHAMPKEWAVKLFVLLEKEEAQATETALEAVKGMKAEIEEISQNLKRLTDIYFAQDIEREDYLARRRSLMSEKKTLEENIARLLYTPTAWLEPAREWIKEASILDEIAKTHDLPSKKLSLQKIFGSNLSLKSRIVSGNALKHYAELRSARENFAQNSLDTIMEPSMRIGLMVSVLPRQCFTTKL